MKQSAITYVLLGFIAQIIDGAIGMGYGVSLTTFLLSIGVAPAMASASVHTAVIFTSGVSGFSHLRLGNVDRKLFKKLLVPGVMGGVLGACVLTKVPGKMMKPFVEFYLFMTGLIILRSALREVREIEVKTRLFPLGMVGGFLDAIGGGGWGPIVSSTVVARGHNPRLTIGSVNLAEFFVTLAEVGIFSMTVGLVHWQIIIGLIVGGVLAAPLAAYVCKILPSRALMIIVGASIMALSMRAICLTLL